MIKHIETVGQRKVTQVFADYIARISLQLNFLSKYAAIENLMVSVRLFRLKIEWIQFYWVGSQL